MIEAANNEHNTKTLTAKIAQKILQKAEIDTDEFTSIDDDAAEVLKQYYNWILG
jgi:hypothetical protein